MKKAEIERRLYTVVSMEEYTNNADLYNAKSTAISIGDMILPVRSPYTDNGPGVYYRSEGKTCEVIKPARKHEKDYSISKIIDFDSAKDIGEVIEKNTLLRDLQSDLMVNGGDNIFYLTISPDDTPEMKALKTAINSKQVDKKVYEDRFSQFQNDMRLLKGNSITLSKLIGICDGFDISCIMTLRDRDNAANPMGIEVTMDLTEGRPMKNGTA